MKLRFKAEYFLSIQGGGRRNNCFIATDNKVVLGKIADLEWEVII